MEDEYVIQNKRSVVGNCVLFWRKNGSGYTCDLQEAWVVTLEKAKSICQDRPKEDFPLKKSDLQVQHHVDSQFV